jgi:hypothetical protein
MIQAVIPICNAWQQFLANNEFSNYVLAFVSECVLVYTHTHTQDSAFARMEAN